MMQVVGVPTYERLLESWEGQYASQADLEAFSRALCTALGLPEPGYTFSRRRTVRRLATYRCGTVLNYDRVTEDGQEWWAVGTQIHELAHHVVQYADQVPAGFRAQLTDAARLAGTYYAGPHQPKAHGPDFYLACQMLHRQAERYFHDRRRQGGTR